MSWGIFWAVLGGGACAWIVASLVVALGLSRVVALRESRSGHDHAEGGGSAVDADL